MIYERRHYKVADGCGPRLLRRFQEDTLPLMQRHGWQLLGFWITDETAVNELFYILVWNDAQHRDRCYKSFLNDPVWIAARARSEADAGGRRLVLDIESTLWNSPSFAPRPEAWMSADTFEEEWF